MLLTLAGIRQVGGHDNAAMTGPTIFFWHSVSGASEERTLFIDLGQSPVAIAPMRVEGPLAHTEISRATLSIRDQA